MAAQKLWKTLAIIACMATLVSWASTALAVNIDPAYECNPNVRKVVLLTGSPLSVGLFTAIWVAMIAASLRVAKPGSRLAVFGRALLLLTLAATLYMAVNDAYSLYNILVHGAQPNPECYNLFPEVI
jgi:hypothetical protein